MKQTLAFLISLLLLNTSVSLADDQIQCSGKNIPIKVAGFLGFGKAAKVQKQIATLVPDNSGTNDKVMDIGEYRFIHREGQWEVLKNFKEKGFLKQNPTWPLKVFADQPIYVSQRGGDTLEVRRNSDDVHSTSMKIKFLPSQAVEVSGNDGKKLMQVSACPSQAPAGTSGKGSLPIGAGVK